jgi:hypothetical protein
MILACVGQDLQVPKDQIALNSSHVVITRALGL